MNDPTTIATTDRSVAAVVARAIAEYGDGATVTVAWGLLGASPDGYDHMRADVDMLRRAIAFGRSRVAGKRGHRVWWGLPDDVHVAVYSAYDAAREAERRARWGVVA